jgi:hypothetical protein
MTDYYSDCRRLITLGGVMAEVHASRNETVRVYVRTMHDGRNDRMEWISGICRLVACCTSKRRVGS